MSITPSQLQKPWYRQFWPWALLSVPITSVILSMIMLTVAINGQDTVVVDNYYKEGLGINEALGKDQFAKDLGLTAEIQFLDDQRVDVRVSANESIAPEFLTFKLFHPTLAGQDTSVQLAQVGPLQFEGTLPQPLSGRWYFDLLDDQELWRLKGQVHLPREDAIIVGGTDSP